MSAVFQVPEQLPHFDQKPVKLTNLLLEGPRAQNRKTKQDPKISFCHVQTLRLSLRSKPSQYSRSGRDARRVG